MESEDRLPLSYIAQYRYCPRRAALLMNQQLWTENEFTAEGRLEHERTHTSRVERRGDKLSLFEFPVWSDVLGVNGKCDCIEAALSQVGAVLPGETGKYKLFPVEYKHGPVRQEPEYEQQLCAQAICLEEMYDTKIADGALFYIDSHRRQAVAFTKELRDATQQTAQALWDCWKEHSLPAAQECPKCVKCSMKETCGPAMKRTAQPYCDALLAELEAEKA